MSASRKLVLVDGSSYLYRAFHALPPLTTSTGEPTGAILGVLNMLLKLLKEESPQLVAVVFDASGRTFRDDLFAEYKANRQSMPDDLRKQVQPLMAAVEALGLPLLRIAGVEADDVIGTLAIQAAAQGVDVVISTIDKDMAQLVRPGIMIVNTMSDSRLDRDGVKAKFDVFPEQIIDYLALVGDTSDNIPGVPKVGPKTAAKWLGEYGTLDELLKNADKVSGKVGENLRGSLEAVELSRKLATIDCQVTVPTALEALTRAEPQTERLREMYTKLELRSLLRALDAGAAPATEAPGAPATAPAPQPAAASADRHYELVLTEEAFESWLEKLRGAEQFALSIRTTSPNYMRGDIVGFAFALTPGAAAYIPVAHRYAGAPEQLSLESVLSRLKPIFEDEGREKTAFDLKYEAHVLKRYSIDLKGMRYDAMLESYVWNSTATRHEIDALAKKYLTVPVTDYASIAGKGVKEIPFDQIAVDIAMKYAAECVDISLQLNQALRQQLATLPPLIALYENIERPLVPVLLRVEQAGVLIDGEKLRRQSSELAQRMQELQTESHRAAGGAFNVDSPKQLQEVLFVKLGLPVLGKTASGQPSTAENVLEQLAENYELPRLIMEYRAVSKLKSTYTDKLPEQINPTTGRVHTSYQQAVAATGRLSSTDPNLQNIPVRTREGRRIRQAFIPPPGYRIVAADYSQIELRIMAHLSGDASLLSAFAEDLDIHQATAAEVFGLKLEEVTADQRRSSKAINFGLIYGMSAFGLAKQLGIERGQAQRYIELYFERYPGVRRYMEETRQKARELGFVETVFGRRLYLPDIRAPQAAMRQYAERSAINAPMQGTAADIIKRAMIEVDRWLTESRIDARLIMQVHDELVFEVRESAVGELTANVPDLMSRAAELRVPLKVDAGIGNNWDEAH
jgi:DNA polymerase-1